jgi:LuxR family maltose regulon positive regulatory protein
VAVALDATCPGVAARVVSLLGPPTPARFDGLAAALINELATDPRCGEVVLILDDYHVIDAQLVHASLTYLSQHRPPNLFIILTSRADPPLPLARMRVRGEVAEVRAADCASHPPRQRRC